jgi:phosphohistidine phosphatase
MKSLNLVRHAKSSWKYPDLEDFERPLNKRGKHDAPMMGRRLNDKKISPDLIISSLAVRAATTAKIISECLSYPLDKINYNDQLYEASGLSLMNIISEIDNQYKSVMLVGHNPGLTTVANLLSDKQIMNIPTCGIFSLEIDISSWSEISENCAMFSFFEYPKKDSK